MLSGAALSEETAMQASAELPTDMSVNTNSNKARTNPTTAPVCRARYCSVSSTPPTDSISNVAVLIANSGSRIFNA
jgi:hypothetical protein